MLWMFCLNRREEVAVPKSPLAFTYKGAPLPTVVPKMPSITALVCVPTVPMRVRMKSFRHGLIKNLEACHL